MTNCKNSNYIPSQLMYEFGFPDFIPQVCETCINSTCEEHPLRKEPVPRTDVLANWTMTAEEVEKYCLVAGVRGRYLIK